MIGNPDATKPVYDIDSIRDVVLGVGSSDVTPLKLEPNPLFSQRARLGQGHGPEQALLWLAIGAAVLVLGGLTLRTVRRESDDPPERGPTV